MVVQRLAFFSLALLSLVDPVNAADPSATVPLDAPLRERCLKLLRGGLASDEFWPAMHAAEALTFAGLGDEVRTALWPRVDAETDAQRRCGLAREIVRAGDRRALPILFEVLGRESDYGHTHAAESLYKIAEVGDGRRLRQLFADPQLPRRRLMAAAALARCGNRTALAFFREQLTSTESESRKIAAWILARLGDSTDTAGLQRMFDGEADLVAKAYAAHALACLGVGAGVEELERNLSHANNEIRTYAAEIVGHARAVRLQSRLVQALDDPWLDVRLRAAQSLVVLNQPVAADLGEFFRDVYPASKEHPRYSEGSVAVLDNGQLLYATTEFQGSGSDFARAQIVARTSADGGQSWSEPRVVQENVGKNNVMSVSFVRPRAATRTEHPLAMYYLQKDGFRDLHVFVRESPDDGRTWGPSRKVTASDGYHVMNNDRVVRLRGGRLVCPISFTEDVQKVNHFVVFCYLSEDGGATWRRGRGTVDQPRRGAMEPEVLELEDGWLLMIIRTQLGHIAAAHSTDGGETWTSGEPWGVRAPEAPSTLRRIPATGQLLLVWNNSVQPGADHGGKRTPLTAAVSSDEGRTWKVVRNLEDRSDQTFAYTSVTFHQDRALLSYYVRDEPSGRISSRFRSIPVKSLD